MYKQLAKIYTNKLRNYVKDLLSYADIKIEPDKFLGFILSFGFLFSLALAINLKAFFHISFFTVFFLSFISSQFSVYSWLVIKIQIKSNHVEEILPDALQLMANNLRAGLTTERAILLASRPEFGSLQQEIDKVGRRLAVGIELSEALSGMSKKIKSNVMEKTLLLIKSGLESGGSLAPLLEQIAENLREQQMVKKRIRANVLMYVIFIFTAVSLGSPMLFGLSPFVIQILTKNIASIEIPQEAASSVGLPFTITQIGISESFVISLVITSLITNSLMASLTLGLIGNGKEKEGLKYFPIMITISLLIFFLVRLVLRTMFSTLFGI